MIRISKESPQTINQLIREGKIDSAMLSTTSFVDEIILAMKQRGIIDCMRKGFIDKRADNSSVPFEMLLSLAVAAKMRLNTSLTDIPFALQDHRTISELGYALWSTNRDLNTGMMSEGTIRAILDKYSAEEFINGYNQTVQNHISPLMSLEPTIHILDCTTLQVHYWNTNYENATVTHKKGSNMRGYKLSTLRGLVGDSGIIEDIRLDSINTNDFKLSREMLMTSPCLKEGDILLADRGFLDRNTINYLKSDRQVDIYIPLRESMIAFETAVSIAKENSKWKSHPTRRNQKISFIPNLRDYWHSKNPERDVEINSCVVWDTEFDKYRVFITTDLTASGSQIIKTYQLRPEIEEDYRQLKDFWNLEDSRSKKYHTIAFHIVCVLLGYLFFQLFTMLPEGEKWLGKSFPVVCKSYQPKAQNKIVLYSGAVFGVLSFQELFEISRGCSHEVQDIISEILKLL